MRRVCDRASLDSTRRRQVGILLAVVTAIVSGSIDADVSSTFVGEPAATKSDEGSLRPPLGPSVWMPAIAGDFQEGLKPQHPRVRRAGNVSELRQHWMRALRGRTDTIIEINPGSHFRLGGEPLICDEDVHLTIVSSGSTKLNGMHRSQIFKVMGCSLTLRGLSLVNGKAPAGLKEVCRDQGTKVWRPYVNVAASTWGYNRAGVYKPACWDSVRGPATPLFALELTPAALNCVKDASRASTKSFVHTLWLENFLM